MRSWAIEDIIQFPWCGSLSEEYSKLSTKNQSKLRKEVFLAMNFCSDGSHAEYTDRILQISFPKISERSLSFGICENFVHSFE